MAEETFGAVHIAGLAEDGIAMEPEGPGGYRYTFVLAPPAPDGLWSELLLTTYLASADYDNHRPPFVQTVAPQRLTAAFAATAPVQEQLERLQALVARTNVAYLERYSVGSAEREHERAYQQAQAEQLRPARDAAQQFRF